MKAIGLTEFGGPEVLHIVDLPRPEPGPGEVRIRVCAVAVNPTDAIFRAGGRAAQLADRPPPYVPGVDVAGVVDQVGPGTTGRLSEGDRVIALVVPMGPHGGTYAEQLVTGEASAVRAPKDTSHAEASTLLLNSVAARLALDGLGLRAGQAVAVTGAAGAAGGYAIQLARARGLTVIADAPPDGEDIVRALGANHVVARGDRFAGQVRGLSPAGIPGLIDGASLDGAALGAIADGGTALLEEPRDLAEDGTVSLRVAEILPARLAAEAHRRLAAGGLRGRIVLDFETPSDLKEQLLTTPRPEGRGFRLSRAGVPVSQPIAEGGSLAV